LSVRIRAGAFARNAALRARLHRALCEWTDLRVALGEPRGGSGTQRR
jgi:hypothetical protein